MPLDRLILKRDRKVVLKRAFRLGMRTFLFFAEKHPLLYKRYASLRLREYPPERTVLIYSNGKTGTSSLTLSLNKYGTPAIQTDILYPPNILTTRHHPWGVPLVINRVYLNTQKPIKLISLVRLPIDREVSAFFDHFALKVYHGSTTRYDIGQIDVRFKEYLRNRKSDILRDWFIEEMLPCTGVNVYAYPFPVDKGYRTIKRNNVEILIMQIELPNERKEEIVRSYVDNARFRWEVLGRSVSKTGFSDLYKEFKDTAVLEPELASKIARNRKAYHFYGSERIEKHIAGWSHQRRPGERALGC